jgi:hypothetical protein
MKVYGIPIPDSPIDRLFAAEAVPEFAIEVDDGMGFWCSTCKVLDETKVQLYHEDEDCQHYGDHGRTVYGEDPPWGNWNLPPSALERSNAVLVIEAAVKRCPRGIRNGGHMGAMCQCGNQDEDLAEVIHDAPCPLAHADHGATTRTMPGIDLNPGLATDGGRN